MVAASCTVQAEEAAAAYALESAQLLEQSTSATAARLPKINEFRGKKRRGLLSKAEDTSSSRHGALFLPPGVVRMQFVPEALQAACAMSAVVTGRKFSHDSAFLDTFRIACALCLIALSLLFKRQPLSGLAEKSEVHLSCCRVTTRASSTFKHGPRSDFNFCLSNTMLFARSPFCIVVCMSGLYQVDLKAWELTTMFALASL